MKLARGGRVEQPVRVGARQMDGRDKPGQDGRGKGAAEMGSGANWTIEASPLRRKFSQIPPHSTVVAGLLSWRPMAPSLARQGPIDQHRQK
jgi:hypothetical protein